jgi:hypothetical protein
MFIDIGSKHEINVSDNVRKEVVNVINAYINDDQATPDILFTKLAVVTKEVLIMLLDPYHRFNSSKLKEVMRKVSIVHSLANPKTQSV